MPLGWQSATSRIPTNSSPTGRSISGGNPEWTKNLASGFITFGKRQWRDRSTGWNRLRRSAYVRNEIPISKSRRRSAMHGTFLGEFMGTLVLILLGDGVVANVLLKKSKGENSGWIVITTGWGMAVVAGIFTAISFGSADAHLIPAVTIGAAFATGDFIKLVPYALAQMACAISCATL